MELISPFSKDSLFLEANVYNSEKKEIKAAAGVHREHAFFNAQSAWVACESFQLSLGEPWWRLLPRTATRVVYSFNTCRLDN